MSCAAFDVGSTSAGNSACRVHIRSHRNTRSHAADGVTPPTQEKTMPATIGVKKSALASNDRSSARRRSHQHL
eukprot:7134728-Pyramimonas_sp.AAC.1